MAKKYHGKVWEIADRVMRQNELYHPFIDPFKILPTEVYGTEIKGTIDRHRVVGLIDRLRFGRLGYLAATLGYPLSWIHGKPDTRFYKEVIYGPSSDSFSSEQQRLISEIGYLRDLSQIIMCE